MNIIFNFIKKYKWWLLGIATSLAVLLWGPSIYANLSTRGARYDITKTSINSVPKNRVAIVFGAGIYKDGSPTPYLQWRVNTAVKLYKAHRVQKLLMTGDNSTKTYDEPVAMRKLAEKQGVKASDITLDYAGFNTYDSCYRAHAIFGLNSATLVSQGYHLPRAVMTCDGVGVKSVGVNSVNGGRAWTVSYLMREWLSTDKAVLQIMFKPHPTALGKPVPIN
jgi:vancomycin permeability regulator SanA